MTLVRHHAVELNWSPAQISDPKTLILGSFNPYDPQKHPLDYYYGRSSNHFWKSIARILNKDETYFFGEDSLNKKLTVMQNRFCFADVINEIEFSEEEPEYLPKYLEGKIFSNFLDQTIWTTKTKFENKSNIFLKRTYNDSIMYFLNNSKSIKKVIHTMGNNRITNPNKIYPKDFGDYVRKIIKICGLKGIEFSFISLSPSAYAVNNGHTKKDELDYWLKENLFL